MVKRYEPKSCDEYDCDAIVESDDGDYMLHADHAAAIAAKDAEIERLTRERDEAHEALTLANIERRHVRSALGLPADATAEQVVERVKRLVDVNETLESLIAESDGVYGLHLNGDHAPWEELMPGGRFEGWAKTLAALESSDA